MTIFKLLVVAPIFVLSTGVVFREFGKTYWPLRFLSGGMSLLAGGLLISELIKIIFGDVSTAVF